MMNIFRYICLALKYPKYRDYVDEGLGIMARHRRCRKYWDAHLERSKEFQKRALSEHYSSIAVLGAGRLLDLQLPFLESISERMVLIDADPGAVSYARQMLARNKARQDEVKLLELSGMIEKWSLDLKALVAKGCTEEELARFFYSLRVSQDPLVRSSFDAVISLNLLSQIAVYWRERICRILKRRRDLWNERGELSENLSAACAASFLELQEAHIRQLDSCSLKKIVLITDLSFQYYHQEGNPWKVEPALQLDPQKALEEVEWSLYETDSWLWHVAPKGIEHKDYGVMHEVKAWDFSRLQK